MSDASVPPEDRGPHPARFVLGALLVLGGVAWLLEIGDVVEIPWDAVLPSVLIVVGVALVVFARSGRNLGGLTTLGVILTAILSVGTLVQIPFEGGVGERLVRPTTTEEAGRDHELAIGELTVDLSGLDVVASRLDVRASVGMGRLVILVPAGTAVRVHGEAAVGEVNLFGRTAGGFGPDLDAAIPAAGTSPPGELRLDLSVGVGQIELRDE
jgi:hypothetical protein